MRLFCVPCWRNDVMTHGMDSAGVPRVSADTVHGGEAMCVSHLQSALIKEDPIVRLRLTGSSS